MRTKSEVESLIKEYVSNLEKDGVKHSRLPFEVSYYLKSLASIERDPIVADLSRDSAFIQAAIESKA